MGNRLHGLAFSNAFLYITEKCNMRCKHCYLGKRLSHYKNMPLEDIKNAIQFMSINNTKKCTVIGGEPTGCDNFFNTIELLNEYKISCIIDTNGWFNKKMLDKLKSYNIEYISFSLDSSKCDYHDFIRKPGSFEKVIKNIEYAVKLNLNVRIIPTITKYNQNEAKEIITLAKNLGVKNINFHTITKAGNALNNANDLSLNPIQWIHFYKKLEDENNSNDISIWYPPTYALKEDIQFFTNKKKYTGCTGRTLDRISIFPNSSAFICSLFFDYDTDYDGLYNSYFAKLKSNRFSLNKDDNNELNKFFTIADKCIECTQFKYCKGGCPFEQMKGYEDFCKNNKDIMPMCRLWKSEVGY